MSLTRLAINACLSDDQDFVARVLRVEAVIRLTTNRFQCIFNVDVLRSLDEQPLAVRVFRVISL